MRRRFIIIGTIACLVAGFGAATVVGHGGDPSSVVVPGVPGTEVVERVAPDPLGKGGDWGVVSYKDARGKPCAFAGRAVGKKVGTVGGDGKFRPYPTEDGGSCMDFSVAPAGVQISTDTEQGRTTVVGIASLKVRSVMLVVNGASRILPLGAQGAFFAVLPETPFDKIGVTATLKDGSQLELFG